MTRSRDTASIIPTVDAKGDLLVGTADNAIDNLSPGTNGQVLTANSATGTGLEWKTVSATEPVTYSSTTQTVGLSQSFINQTVQVFASAAARNTAIPTPVEGMVAYLEDSNTIEAYNATAWVTVANAGAAAYSFVQTLYFASNGTFTKATYPWLRAIKVKCIGGGGGGGTSTSTFTFASPGGGGGGGYAESFITDISGLAASVTVTRGAGGAGASVSATNGATGGASSFGALVAANGGGGGSQTGSANNLVGTGGSGGVGTAGQLLAHGGVGGTGVNDSLTGIGGVGGNTAFGGGANAPRTVSTQAGFNGLIYGGGGSGSASVNGTISSGGSGANGIVIVELYA